MKVYLFMNRYKTKNGDNWISTYVAFSSKDKLTKVLKTEKYRKVPNKNNEYTKKISDNITEFVEIKELEVL